MKNKVFTLFLGVFLLAISCSQDDGRATPEVKDISASKNKIMPLGASRVEGARPEFESYRFELWKLLVDSGYEFDFIGTNTDDASYPTYQNLTFDMDHEGRGGWTSGQIRQGIEAWLGQTGAPDIVLFSSPGGNDALTGSSYEQAILNVNAIIDEIQQTNPNTTIIIEQLAPARSDAMTPELTNFFIRMRQDVIDISAQQSTDSSKVLVVDMATGFSDSLFADDVHYNEAGALFVAERYYEVLKDILEKN